MKKFISVLLIAILSCIMLLTVSADGSVDRVNDICSLLTADETAALLEKADSVSETYGADVVVVINDTFEEEYLSEYAFNYFTENGFTNGIMLTINAAEGTFWTSAHGTCLDFIGETEIEKIDDAYYNAETYYEGIDAFLNTCELLLDSTGGITADIPNLVDNADLLTDTEETELAVKLDEMSTRLACDVVVLTEPSIDKNAEAYADDYFDYGGYGRGENFDGILFLVSMDPRAWYISGSGICNSEYISTEALEYISENVESNLQDEDYVACFNEYADRCDEVITDARNGKAYKAPFNMGMNLIISIAVGFIVSAIITGSMKSKLKSVRLKKEAANYVKPGSLNIYDARDIFLYRQVTYTEKKQDSDSGSHTSSSGRSHSGVGGSF